MVMMMMIMVMMMMMAHDLTTSLPQLIWFDRESIIPENVGFAISVCRLREKGRMFKSVYMRVFHDLELLRYVLRCAIERQL